MQNQTRESLRLIAGRYLSDFSVLVAVWSLCIAWPMYQVLIAGPTFFSAHNAGRKEILFFVLSLSFGFPLIWAFLSTFASILNRFLRNILFAIGLGLPLTLFLAKTFLYQPWAWLPVWGVWILGVLLVVLACLLTVVLTRWHPTWQGQVLGFSVAILVAGLFVFSSSMSSFFFPKTSQITVASEMITSGEEKKPNIFVLLFDELSLMEMMDAKDQINEKLFPNFAKLSKESLWFPNAYAPYGSTHLTLPAIWTGKYTSTNLPPSHSSYPDSFVSLLNKRGYNIYAHEICSNFFPSTSGSIKNFFGDSKIVFYNVILPPSFISLLNIPSLHSGWSDFIDEESEKLEQNSAMWIRNYDIESFFDSISDIEKYFAFYHFLIPHFPYKFLHDGSFHNLGQYGFKKDTDWLPHQKDIINAVKMQYLQQASYADTLLGKFLEKIKQKNIYENSVIIVLSDHGIVNEAGQQRKIYSEKNISFDLAAVPLFMRIPWEKDSIKHDITRFADILPTLAGSLNWNIPWETDGRNLLAKDLKADDEFLTFYEHPLKSRFQMHKKDYFAGFQNRLAEKKKVFSADYTDATQIYFSDEWGMAGSNVSDYQLTNASQQYIATIDDIHFYKNFTLNNHFFPVFLQGTVNAQSLIPIVFALNGKIFYVGESFHQDKDRELSEFIAYFPPVAFIEGYNTIELFVPVHENGKIYLSPIEIRGRTVHFTDTGDLIYDDRQIKIRNSNTFIQGYTGDIANLINGVLTLSGWAIDKNRVSGVDEILLFVKNEAVAFSGPPKVRSDIALAFNDIRYEQSGFSLVVPNITMEDLVQARLIAVSGNVAKELALPSDLFVKILTTNDNVDVSASGVLNWNGKKFLPCTANDEIKGVIDVAETDNKQLKIQGWVIDLIKIKPAEDLIVFINGQAKVWSTPNILRPDIVKGFNNQEYLKSGFKFKIQLSSVGYDTGAEIKDVQVYGLSSGRYTLLTAFKN